MSIDFSTYVSPFSWRYGTAEMKQIFSEENKYRLWRKIWVTLAAAQYQAGLITKEELEDLEQNETNISIDRIAEIEEETGHDVAAAIREFGEKSSKGVGKIHLGATSMDIVDNADSMRIQKALSLTEKNCLEILKLFAQHIEKYAGTACMGYTHLQPAEPTTVGYRLALYAQDILIDLDLLHFVMKANKAKGMKGAVGTRASFVSLLQGSKMNAEELDQAVMSKLGLETALITNQVYPRKYDYLVLTFIASLASSLAKFAGDLRLLQSPTIGEWSEPFGKKQVGSSAMPFKKNPVNSEKICSLARFITQLPPIALENATHSYLERTLDDSANKRVIIAEAFIALDEILKIAKKVLAGLVINEKRIGYNLTQYAPFAATESMLLALTQKGADRQEMHELLRKLSMTAWQRIQHGTPNPMQELLLQNKTLQKYLKSSDMRPLFDIERHIGDAPQRAKKLLQLIQKTVTN